MFFHVCQALGKNSRNGVPPGRGMSIIAAPVVGIYTSRLSRYRAVGARAGNNRGLQYDARLDGYDRVLARSAQPLLDAPCVLGT
jgi:hypothetical protein